MGRSAGAISYGGNVEGLDNEVGGLRFIAACDIDVEVGGVVADEFVACLGMYATVQLRGEKSWLLFSANHLKHLNAIFTVEVEERLRF